MQIVVGPVSAASAQAWLGYADKALAHLRSLDSSPVSAPALDGFETLLRQWQRIAARPGPFHWVSEEDPERAEYLINALYQAGEAMEREGEGHPDLLRPPEADEFHIRLIDGVLAALSVQGPPYSQFADEIRRLWEISELE